jgi:hypothetical protein
MISTRETILQADFLNNYIIFPQTELRIQMDNDTRDKFFSSVIDSFWNSDRDKLEFFSIENNGQYFCQRRKLKYDAVEKISYWTTYNFKGASKEQALELGDKIKLFFDALTEIKELKIEQKIDEIDQDIVFFERRYLKKVRERNTLLQMSDWRVLPDVVDTYPGEKDMWIAWRSHLRQSMMKKIDDFDGALEFFKWTCDIKIPIDPKNYRKLYPNGLLEDGVTPAPEFMDPNDQNQWVTHDAEASTDFMNDRKQSIYNMSGMYKESKKRVDAKVLEIMKLLGVEDIVPVDWSKYYTDDSEIAE